MSRYDLDKSEELGELVLKEDDSWKWARVNSKVGAGALAAPLSVLLVWGLQSAGIAVPEHVSQAITGILIFVFGWLAKP